MGFTQHGLTMGGGTRIATHNAGSGPRMSKMGSGGSSGIARLMNIASRCTSLNVLTEKWKLKRLF